jgi:hypothetical protein
MSQRRITARVTLGKPAPPAPESDTTPEALRAVAETYTLAWWIKYAGKGWETLLESPAADVVEDNDE